MISGVFQDLKKHIWSNLMKKSGEGEKKSSLTMGSTLSAAPVTHFIFGTKERASFPKSH